MSKPLVALGVEAPGFLGLNSQNSGAVLPIGWASVLENYVWDDIGRLASRGGTQKINATVIPSTPTIRQIHEYVDASGSKLTILAADNKIYKEVNGTMTDISASMTTPTADNWQFVNFNGKCLGYQKSHIPIELATVGTSSFVDGGGTQQNGTAALAAYGRVWTVLGNTLFHTDLLINSYAGGSSGSFDLAKFWPNGMDVAVAIADFNGFLVVFGKNSIIIYENPDDVSNMAIADSIDGLGCIARDSIQSIGKELVFLSNTGLRTLGRVIQEKSMPITDISKNVRDALLGFVTGETADNIKSVYNSKDGFYLLSLPTTATSYLFDLKFPNPDKSLKVARWDFAPTALHYTEGLLMQMAVSAGFLSKYFDFKDEKLSDGTGGFSYLIDFEGVWNDFAEAGEHLKTLLKILKRVNILAAGTPGGGVNFKWAVDYSETFTQRQILFDATDPSRYNDLAKYNTEGDATEFRYATVGDFERIRSSLSRSGQVIKIGLTATINDFKFALQRIDLLVKIGKLGI